MTTTDKLRSKFPYVSKWARWVNAPPKREEEMLRRAEATFAPPNAVYELKKHGKPTGKWHTTDLVLWGKLREFLGV